MIAAIFADALKRAAERQLSVMELLAAVDKLMTAGETALVIALYRTWTESNPSDPMLYAMQFNFGVVLSNANDLPGAVPEEVKEERWHRFMATQQAVSARRMAAKVGRVMPVIVDAVDGTKATARTRADAPEIDGVVHLTGAQGLRQGDIVEARITRADAYDLWGRPAVASRRRA